MEQRNKEQRLSILREVDLYQVTSEPLSMGRSTLEVVDAALAAGVKMIQLREKQLSKRELYHLACTCRERMAGHDSLLIINDHIDVALAAGADGVHLGQSDLPVSAARQLAGDFILGASSHSLAEALAVEGEGADYVNIGPVFPTQTKPDAPEWVGPAAVSQISRHLGIAYTCMGGINRTNIGEVLEAGGRIVAVISAVTAADDPTAAARELRQLIQASR